MKRRGFLKGLIALFVPISIQGCSNAKNFLSIDEYRDDVINNDYTLAFKNALSHLKKCGGGKLYLPSAKYVLNKDFEFGLFSEFENIEIFGDGDASEIVIVNSSLSFGGVQNFKLSNLKFTRDQNEVDTYRKKHQINISNFQNVTISDVTFDCFGVSDGLMPVPGSTILFLYGGGKRGSVQSSEKNIVEGDSANFRILNSRFRSGGDRTLNFGIRVYSEFIVQDQYGIKGGEISGCKFDGFNWNACEILGRNTTDIHVYRSQVYSGGLTGIEIDKGASHCSIKNCSFRDLKGNIDVHLFPNTAITGVLLQGDSVYNLKGYANLVENVVCKLGVGAAGFENKVNGIVVSDQSRAVLSQIDIEMGSKHKYEDNWSRAICLVGSNEDIIISLSRFNGFELDLIVNDQEYDIKNSGCTVDSLVLRDVLFDEEYFCV
ncbi:MAG: hypothetical protein ACI8SR_001292 [Oceanicoccus sp.]|jgi:hypothetical protein